MGFVTRHSPFSLAVDGSLPRTTTMRSLLQQASRSLIPNATPSTASRRSIGSFAPSICLSCQSGAAPAVRRRVDKVPFGLDTTTKWSRRTFTQSRRWLEDREPPKPSDPIPMPPPPTESSSSQEPEKTSWVGLSPEEESRLQERFAALVKQQEEETKRREEQRIQEEKKREEDRIKAEEKRRAEEKAKEEEKLREERKKQQEEAQQAQLKAAPESAPSTIQPARPQDTPRTSPKNDVADNIARVPDDQLPSHRERQRWSLSKRFSEAMDELLPKLAVVTHKVNTYTGTDYSGVEALRQEIIEQGT